MLRQIKLYGNLAERYGSEFNLAVETPAEAIRALCVQLRGFEQDVRAGEFVCVRGDYDAGVECDEPLLVLRLGSIKQFHIIPAAVGRKSGVGKILIGLALIAATVFTAGAALGAYGAFVSTSGFLGALSTGLGGFGLYGAAAGALLVLGGVSQMIAPTPSGAGSGSTVDQKPGYLFNGATNTSQQGGACPLVFGRIIAGSVVVSAGVVSERVGAAGTDYSPSSGNLTYTNMDNFQLA